MGCRPCAKKREAAAAARAEAIKIKQEQLESMEITGDRELTIAEKLKIAQEEFKKNSLQFKK